MNAVSIIIPCYNEEKMIGRVLDAIYAQTYPHGKIEVVIADGLSTDGTREVIAGFVAEHPELRVMVVDNTLRHIPAGINCAIKAASGDLIVRMDGHSIPEVDYIANCVRGHEQGLGDNIGGVWDIRPGGTNWVARSIAVAAGHPLGAGDAGYRLNSPAGEVDTVPFGSFQKELFERIGVFNENLLSNEDYEFNARIRKNGGKVYLDPSIRCRYIARANLADLSRQYFRYGYWKFQMLRLYPGTLRWRQAIPPVFVASLIGLLILSIFWGVARYVLAVELLIYLAALVLAGGRAAVKNKDWGMAVGLPLALATMHVSWGGGFLWSMIKSALRLKSVR